MVEQEAKKVRAIATWLAIDRGGERFQMAKITLHGPDVYFEAASESVHISRPGTPFRAHWGGHATSQ
ncbi:hypothetical protein [Ktedonospora formicarum]|uniref:Uncharacterized protein n=1 Tax=Ktedonospora formicarum TaxID=2778364 RepID=A0A8J3I5T7_9CHLR|nr:hypothetical protein [Ktedonospora formicarum]GHO50867.1 hypothetical protein KSX_90300 [Ktedonospora formicarum]